MYLSKNSEENVRRSLWINSGNNPRRNHIMHLWMNSWIYGLNPGEHVWRNPSKNFWWKPRRNPQWNSWKNLGYIPKGIPGELPEGIAWGILNWIPGGICDKFLGEIKRRNLIRNLMEFQESPWITHGLYLGKNTWRKPWRNLCMNSIWYPWWNPGWIWTGFSEDLFWRYGSRGLIFIIPEEIPHLFITEQATVQAQHFKQICENPLDWFKPRQLNELNWKYSAPLSWQSHWTLQNLSELPKHAVVCTFDLSHSAE